MLQPLNYLARGSHESHQTRNWSLMASCISSSKLQPNYEPNTVLLVFHLFLRQFKGKNMDELDMNCRTFQVNIERTLITPSDPPKATRGPS